MKRRIITRVIAFLLLGAIVNVAVAWGGACWFSFLVSFQHECPVCALTRTTNHGSGSYYWQSGYPARSMYGVLRHDRTEGLWVIDNLLARMWLPLHPIWPGFAINTIFYAAILWLLFAAPFAFRRWRRTKRGLCPACAYPVGGSPICTECGKPLPSH